MCRLSVRSPNRSGTISRRKTSSTVSARLTTSDRSPCTKTVAGRGRALKLLEAASWYAPVSRIATTSPGSTSGSAAPATSTSNPQLMPTTSASCVTGRSARLATTAVQRLCSIRPSGRNISVVSSSTQRCAIGRVCAFTLPHGGQVDARVGEQRAAGLGLQPHAVRRDAVAPADRRAATWRPRRRTPRSSASARRRAVACRAWSRARSDRAARRTRRRRRSRAASSRPTRADSAPIVSAKLDAIARQTSTAWWCRPRCAITPATSSSSAASASGPAASRSSVGIPGLYADAASRIGTSVSANSVSVSSPS